MDPTGSASPPTCIPRSERDAAWVESLVDAVGKAARKPSNPAHIVDITDETTSLRQRLEAMVRNNLITDDNLIRAEILEAVQNSIETAGQDLKASTITNLLLCRIGAAYNLEFQDQLPEPRWSFRNLLPSLSRFNPGPQARRVAAIAAAALVLAFGLYYGATRISWSSLVPTSEQQPTGIATSDVVPDAPPVATTEPPATPGLPAPAITAPPDPTPGPAPEVASAQQVEAEQLAELKKANEQLERLVRQLAARPATPARTQSGPAPRGTAGGTTTVRFRDASRKGRPMTTRPLRIFP